MTEEQLLQTGLDDLYAERFEQALAVFEQATKLYPTSCLAHCRKGDALQSLDRFTDALAAYERAIQLDPNEASAHGLKGLVLIKFGRYAAAKAALERAIQLDPSYEGYRRQKERVLQALAKPEKWWMIRIGRRDKDSNGNHHSLEKYAGPFSCEADVMAEIRRVQEHQYNYFKSLREADEGLFQEYRWVLLETDYGVFSEEALENARRRGIRIY